MSDVKMNAESFVLMNQSRISLTVEYKKCFFFKIYEIKIFLLQ